MKTGVPIKSTRKNKKLMVLTPKGNIIHFGDSSMKDFRQHKDKKRQTNFCLRSAGIKSKGKLTKNNKESGNYYARKYLWNCDNV